MWCATMTSLKVPLAQATEGARGSLATLMSVNVLAERSVLGPRNCRHIEDPIAAEADGHDRAFRQAHHALQRRIPLFLSIPLDGIDEISLRNRDRPTRRRCGSRLAAF